MEAIVIKQNTLLSHVANELEPRFPDHFLTTVYDPFLQSLSAGDTEGLEVYTKANTDLKVLCANVLTLAEEDRLALIDADSTLYASAKDDIQTFCETYQDKLTF